MLVSEELKLETSGVSGTAKENTFMSDSEKGLAMDVEGSGEATKSFFSDMGDISSCNLSTSF